MKTDAGSKILQRESEKSSRESCICGKPVMGDLNERQPYILLRDENEILRGEHSQVTW